MDHQAVSCLLLSTNWVPRDPQGSLGIPGNPRGSQKADFRQFGVILACFGLDWGPDLQGLVKVCKCDKAMQGLGMAVMGQVLKGLDKACLTDAPKGNNDL